MAWLSFWPQVGAFVFREYCQHHDISSWKPFYLQSLSASGFPNSDLRMSTRPVEGGNCNTTSGSLGWHVFFATSFCHIDISLTLTTYLREVHVCYHEDFYFSVRSRCAGICIRGRAHLSKFHQSIGYSLEPDTIIHYGDTSTAAFQRDC